MFSSNVRVMFALEATPVALSAGELEDSVGAIISAAVKFNDVVSLMPAYELPLASSSGRGNLKIVTLRQSRGLQLG